MKAYKVSEYNIVKPYERIEKYFENEDDAKEYFDESLNHLINKIENREGYSFIGKDKALLNCKPSIKYSNRCVDENGIITRTGTTGLLKEVGYNKFIEEDDGVRVKIFTFTMIFEFEEISIKTPKIKKGMLVVNKYTWQYGVVENVCGDEAEVLLNTLYEPRKLKWNIRHLEELKRI